MGGLEGRIAKLEAAMPDPEAGARGEDFRRSVAILDEFQRHAPLHAPLKDCPDLDGLIGECVPRGLSAYGLSDEEVAEEAPAYVEYFKAIFRDLDAAEEEGKPR